jgi:hypothetical protein
MMGRVYSGAASIAHIGGRLDKLLENNGNAFFRG